MGETGKVAISASEKEGGKWVRAGGSIYHEDGDRVTGFGTGKKEPAIEQLPVGKYYLDISYNQFKKEKIPFEIKAGETTKVHVVFSPFLISAKCPNAGSKVSYEIYGSDGRLIFDKKMNCSDTWKVILDDGDYSIEAAIDGGKGEAKFSVGAGKPNKLIIDLSNLNHEEEIKADSPEEVVVVPVTPKKEAASKVADSQNSEKITIGDKQIEVKGISKEDAEKLKNLGAMLGALGGMMQANKQASGQEQKPDQGAKNAEADKEFEEMSKDLDMYTK